MGAMELLFYLRISKDEDLPEDFVSLTVFVHFTNL